MIDQQQLANLRAKAEAATPGPWVADEECVVHPRPDIVLASWLTKEASVVVAECGGVAFDSPRPADASFIAAANPATVLAMIDEIEKHRDDDNLAVMNEDFCKLLRSLGISDHARSESCHRIMHDEILPEIERLRERNAKLERVREAALKLGPGPGEACYCCEAQAWVEFDAALDAAKEATDG